MPHVPRRNLNSVLFLYNNTIPEIAASDEERKGLNHQLTAKPDPNLRIRTRVFSANGVNTGSGSRVHSQVLAQILLPRPVQVAGTHRSPLQFRYLQIQIQIQISNSNFISPTLIWFSLSDIDGDALHSSVGLPPALNVATAKVGKLEITVELLTVTDYVSLLRCVSDRELWFAVCGLFCSFRLWAMYRRSQSSCILIDSIWFSRRILILMHRLVRTGKQWNEAGDALCFLLPLVSHFLLLSITAVPRCRLPLPREVVMVSLIRFELASALCLSNYEFIYAHADNGLFVVKSCFGWFCSQF